MFGVRAVRMAESPGLPRRFGGMTAAVNDHTIMLVGSAPPYPYGTTDSLGDLSALAQRPLAPCRCLHPGLHPALCPSAGIRAIPELEIWGDPHAYHFAFGSRRCDIAAVADRLADDEWVVGRALEPPSIQLMINMAHRDIVEEFLADLKTAVTVLVEELDAVVVLVEYRLVSETPCLDPVEACYAGLRWLFSLTARGESP